MTETEWLKCDDMVAMLFKLTVVNQSYAQRNRTPPARWSISDRKLALIYCALYRDNWDLLSHLPSRRAIVVTEGHIDDPDCYNWLSRHYLLRQNDWPETEPVGNIDDQTVVQDAMVQQTLARWYNTLPQNSIAAHMISLVGVTPDQLDARSGADIVREIFGNPYHQRPIKQCWACQGYGNTLGAGPDRGNPGCAECRAAGHLPDAPWITPAVRAHVNHIYAKRAHDELPVLADEIEYNGCHDTAIIAHCRQQPTWIEISTPGQTKRGYWSNQHRHGCWVVDYILNYA